MSFGNWSKGWRLTGSRALLLCAALTLGACETLPEAVGGGARVSEADAQSYFDSGNYKQAADAYTRLAKRNREKRARFQLMAAQAWREEGDYVQVKTALKELKRKQLQDDDALVLDMLDADLALQNGDGRTALDLLIADEKQLPMNLRMRFVELRGRAFAIQGDFADAARERARLNEWLEPLDRTANEHELKALVEKLSQEERRDLKRSLTREDPLLKWLGGGRSDPRTGGGQSFAEAVSANIDVRKAVSLEGLPRSRARRIALILPTGGQLAPAAKAVQDGILAGYFADSSPERPEIVILDSGTTVQSAQDAVAKASSEGADAILGPFQRDQITGLFAQNTLSIPMLALNFAESNVLPPRGSLQMALLPEEEAVAAAERLWNKGYQRVSMLTPNDEFGARVASAFEARFVALGGSIGERSNYAAAGTNFTESIRSALGVTESMSRIAKVRSIIDMEITAQPSRRYDLDALFLAARPAPARLLLPQLRAFDAEDWPVISTSHIYGGTSAPQDKDLEGVEFCDTPWLFGVSNDNGLPTRSNVSALPSSVGAGGRLFAFGIDAYRVLSVLDWLESNPDRAIRGATGLLSADQNGSVRRLPGWAVMNNGSARLLND